MHALNLAVAIDSEPANFMINIQKELSQCKSGKLDFGGER